MMSRTLYVMLVVASLSIPLSLTLILLPQTVFAQTTAPESLDDVWRMAGANPERTSWLPSTPQNQTEIRGKLYPVWYRSFEPFINLKVQVVTADDTLYISTSKGLYALSTDDLDGDGVAGDLKWVFPTELPLGNSPTVAKVNGANLLFVGGYDHNLYALEANPALSALPRVTDSQGNQLRRNNRVAWTFTAGAGFETNPLVVNSIVYAGNRDGYFYAVNAASGKLVFRVKTGGPVLFSAAYKDNTVYFASNDGRAYALNARTGALRWRSVKLPGGGFYSYWPVIYTHAATGKDYVILGGEDDYMTGANLGIGQLNNALDGDALYPDRATDPPDTLIGPAGKEPGDWAAGTVTIDAQRTAEYYEDNPNPDPDGLLRKPWRRRYFILDASTGREYTFDSDGDGYPEYAPISWYGTHSGNRYPALVSGIDNVLYQGNSYVSGLHIPRGGPSGWKFGTQYISRVHEGNYGAVDEPLVYSGGGKLLYWSWFSGRETLGSYDLTLPYGSPGRYWSYWGANDVMPYLMSVFPASGVMYNQTAPAGDFYSWGKTYGLYRRHGNQNPAIPYKGKLYFHMFNAVYALAPSDNPEALEPPLLGEIEVSQPVTVTTGELKRKLEEEIRKIIGPCIPSRNWTRCHLRPGYHDVGLGMDNYGSNNSYLAHYFHNPADTFVALARAYPHLSPALQAYVKAYADNEFNLFGSQTYYSWSEGQKREIFDTPPEIEAAMDATTHYFSSPVDVRYSIYGHWKYVERFGDAAKARAVFDGMKGSFDPAAQPEDDPGLPSIYQPYVDNAFLAGFEGYINLGKMAGYSEDSPELAPYIAAYEALLARRTASFSKDQPDVGDSFNALTIARNFMFLTPGLAGYFRDHALPLMKETLDEYEHIAPGWFVAKYDATRNEGTLHTLYDYHALFSAKAWILQEPREELVKYLDVPAFQRGDMFYIQNLVTAIEAPFASCPLAVAGDTDCNNALDLADYLYITSHYGSNDPIADLNSDGRVNFLDLMILLLNMVTARESGD